MSPQLSSRARGRLRRAGLIGLALAVLAAVAWFGVGLLFQRLLDQERLARWSEARLEATLNRDVHLERVALSVFPRPAAELHGLRVDNPSDLELPAPLLRLERARLQVALWPLLRRRVVVEEVMLIGPELHLSALEDGRSNYGDLVPSDGSEPPAGGSPFHMEVEEVRLEDGSLIYRRPGTGLRLEVKKITVRAAIPPADGARLLDADLEIGALGAEGLPGGRRLRPIPARLTLEGRLGRDGGLVLEAGRIRAGDVSLGISGRVDSLARPVRRLDLRLAADPVPVTAFRELLGRLAPKADGGAPEPDRDGTAPEAAGRLSVDLAVSGPWGPELRPDLGGTVRLREGRAGPAGGPAVIREATALVRVDQDSLSLEELRGRLLEGELEARGALRLDSTRRWRLSVRARPSLDAWPRERNGEFAGLGGTVETDLALRGSGAERSSVRAAGTLRPRGLTFARPDWSGPLEFPSGTVRLAGDSAVAEGMPVVAGGDTLLLDLTVSGALDRVLRDGPVPSVAGVLRGGRLDLDAVLGRPSGEEISRTRLALARLGGRPVEGMAVQRLVADRAGLPDSLPVRGTLRLEVEELIRRPRRLTDVSLRLELSPGGLSVTDARFGFLGGRAEGGGSLALGAPPAPFRLRLRMEEVPAAELLATSTPVGRLVTGRAAVELEVAGRVDSLLLPVAEGLEGSGRLVFTEGQLRSNPVTSAVAAVLRSPALESPGFRRWQQPFTLRGDTLRLDPASLEGLPVPLRIGGTLGLGGRLDLTVTGDVPRETARALARGTAGLPASLLERLGEGGSLPVALRVAGTVDSPRVQVDAASLREALQAAARREAGEAARRGAEGLLRRLLDEPPPPADTAGTPPDSAGGGRR